MSLRRLGLAMVCGTLFAAGACVTTDDDDTRSAGAGGVSNHGDTAGGAGPAAGTAGSGVSDHGDTAGGASPAAGTAGSGVSDGGSTVGAAGSGVSEGGSTVGTAGSGVSEAGASVATAGAAGAGADFDLGPLSFQRDDARAETNLVDETGGYISVTDATGVTWTLSIPDQIGLFPVSVTMTPLKKLTAGADAPALQSGVLFEPEGLVFSDAATLRVTLPEANDSVAFFSFEGDGSGVELAEMTEHSSSFTLPVWHFSGKALAQGASSQKLCSLAQKQWAAAKRQMNAIFALPYTVPTPPKVDLRCANLDGKDQARQQTVDTYVRTLLEPERAALERGTGAAISVCSCGLPACDEWPTNRTKLLDRWATKALMVLDGPAEAEYQFPIVSAAFKLLRRLEATGYDVSDAGIEEPALERLDSARQELLRRIREEHDYQQAQGYAVLTNEYAQLGGTVYDEDVTSDLADALHFQVNLDVNLFQDAPSVTDDEGVCTPAQQASITVAATADYYYDVHEAAFLPEEVEYRFTLGTLDEQPFIDAPGCGYTSHCDLEAGARQTAPFELGLSSCIDEKSRVVLRSVGGDEPWQCAVHYPQAPEDDFTHDSNGLTRPYWDAVFESYYEPSGNKYVLPAPMENGNATPVDLTISGESEILDATGQMHLQVVHTPG
ncbi:MAG: hypothetical protein JW940_00850 [Polyangiaceae bacterium]|nr:hypothetical protein [Polyangiaceae bacterium]